MAEAIMVLPPDMRRQQIVQGGRSAAASGKSSRHFQPFGVLIEHGIDDVDEGFVTGEQTVPTGQQIAFEPTLAEMFAQHLHHATFVGEMNVVRFDVLHPGAVGHLENRVEPVRGGFVRAHDSEIARLGIQFESRRANTVRAPRRLSLGLYPVRRQSRRILANSGVSNSRRNRPPLACGLAPIRRAPSGASAASSGRSRPVSSNSVSGA